MITRHALYGGARGLYGDFSTKLGGAMFGIINIEFTLVGVLAGSGGGPVAKALFPPVDAPFYSPLIGRTGT